MRLSNAILANVILVAAAAVACQRTQYYETGGNVTTGTTTFARGAPVTQSETLKVIKVDRGVRLTVDRAIYLSGGQMTLRVTNLTNDTLSYNACSNRAIERWEDIRWVTHEEPQRMCTLDLRWLNPRESQSAVTALPTSLTSGTYRLVLSLSRQRPTPSGAPEPVGSDVRAISPTFQVQ